jgi:hypothetical protein
LDQAIASLKSYGPGAAVGEAVQQLESLLGRIKSGDWSLRERKLRRYQSHSYQKMSSRELWSSGEPPPSFKKPPPSPPTPRHPASAGWRGQPGLISRIAGPAGETGRSRHSGLTRGIPRLQSLVTRAAPV